MGTAVLRGRNRDRRARLCRVVSFGGFGGATHLRSEGSGRVRVRILLGDPESPEVAERGDDEGVGDAMAAKIRNALVMYQALRRIDGGEIRFHRPVLYNSIYRPADHPL